jgi:hypothetical protein
MIGSLYDSIGTPFWSEIGDSLLWKDDLIIRLLQSKNKKIVKVNEYSIFQPLQKKCIDFSGREKIDNLKINCHETLARLDWYFH